MITFSINVKSAVWSFPMPRFMHIRGVISSMAQYTIYFKLDRVFFVIFHVYAGPAFVRK